jgi:hypothetical protein
MDVQGSVLVTYVYQLVDGEASVVALLHEETKLMLQLILQVKVDKVEFRKPESPSPKDTASASNLGASVNSMSLGTPGRMQQSPRIGAGW